MVHVPLRFWVISPPPPPMSPVSWSAVSACVQLKTLPAGTNPSLFCTDTWTCRRGAVCLQTSSRCRPPRATPAPSTSSRSSRAMKDGSFTWEWVLTQHEGDERWDSILAPQKYKIRHSSHTQTWVCISCVVKLFFLYLISSLFGVETTRTEHSRESKSVRSAEQEAAGWFECETACKMQKLHSCDCLVHEVAAKIQKKKKVWLLCDSGAYSWGQPNDSFWSLGLFCTLREIKRIVLSLGTNLGPFY